MLNFRNLSLQRKQMLIIMLTSAVSLLLACAALIAYDVSRFRGEMVASVSSLAEVVGHNTTAAIDFNKPLDAAETLGALRAEPNVVLARVHTRDGQTFATYARAGAPPPPAILHTLETPQVFTATHLHLSRPIMQGGEPIGTIELVADLDELRERLWRYVGIAALVLAVSLLAAFGLSSRLQKLISDPILHLAQVARTVALENNYSLRATKQSSDELGQLVDRFNEMLGQIQQRDGALQSARKELEARVLGRTSELASTNQALQVEISERKRTEERLRVQATALDVAANAIVITDHRGTIQWVNPAFTILTGYTAQEAVGQNLRILKSGKQDDAFYRNLWQTISSGQNWSGELTNRRKDGSFYLEEMTITALRNADGTIARYVAIKQDITERKRAEEQVRRTEALYRSAIAGAGAVPYSLDFKTKSYGFIGEGIQQLIGYAPHEVNGDLWTRIIQTSVMMGEAASLNKAEAARRVRAAELSHWRCDMLVTTREGKARWISDASVQIRDDSGQVTGSVGILQDITERKEAEAKQEQRTRELLEVNTTLQHEIGERERAQSFLNSVVEHLPIPVFIKEAKELRFVLWNRAGEKLTGISNAEMIGKNDFDFFPQADAERNVAKDRAAFASKSVLEIPEEIIQTRDHGARIVHVWKVPIFDAAGQPAFLLGIAEDITERKRVQGELEETHKQLMDASRRGGMAEIATNVLHNVGNVLNSVNISTGLIVERVKKSRASGLGRVVALLREHPHDLGEFITQDAKGKQLPVYLAQLSEHLAADQVAMVGELDSLRQNVEHIKEIVAMQQSYATVGGVKEIVNVVNLVEDSLRMNEGSWSRHGVAIIREFSPMPPLNVEKHKILQIVLNLLRNAKHACEDSERTDKQMTVRVGNGAGWIKISVRDNGVGIPAENLTRIFNHGFTTKKDGHGFGLHSGALAAKEMGGSLTVQSDGPGQGAIFTLELPCPTGENSHE